MNCLQQRDVWEFSNRQTDEHQYDAIELDELEVGLRNIRLRVYTLELYIW